jgi:hypothetical protein
MGAAAAANPERNSVNAIVRVSLGMSFPLVIGFSFSSFRNRAARRQFWRRRHELK